MSELISKNEVIELIRKYKEMAVPRWDERFTDAYSGLALLSGLLKEIERMETIERRITNRMPETPRIEVPENINLVNGEKKTTLEDFLKRIVKEAIWETGEEYPEEYMVINLEDSIEVRTKRPFYAVILSKKDLQLYLRGEEQ